MAAMTHPEVFETVRAIIVDVLELDPDQVREDTKLAELELESVDILDMLFRLQKTLGVRVRPTDLEARLRGPLAEAEFAAPDGTLTDSGWEQARQAMPQLERPVPAADLLTLFTIGNLVAMIEELQSVTPPAG